jgi:hypothetical protein
VPDDHKGERMTETDEFGSNGYSRDQFYVTATDNRGHSLKVRLSVPPPVKGQIAALIASKAIPMYRTEEDFHRDALVHRLHDLSEFLQGDHIVSSEIASMSRIMQAEAQLEILSRRKQLDEDAEVLIMAMLRDSSDDHAILDASSLIANEIKDERIRSRITNEINRYQSK